MPNEILTFDAAGSNADGTDPGTALLVGPGTPYLLRAFDAPTPPQTVQWAGSIDTEGSLPAGRKHENRQITLTIMCATLTALRTLQLKIGKIAREGGTLKWAVPDGVAVFFDLHSTDTFSPTIDVTYYKNAGAYGEVSVTLPAKPYGRGASVTLSLHTATTGAPHVFTETGIKGDIPAIGSLRVVNATNTKSVGWWGLRSQHYDAASTAALFYEAELGQAITATAAVGPAGASGGGTNKVMHHTSVGTTGSESYVIRPGGGGLTLVGTYRVFMRAQAAVANTGIVSTQFSYLPQVSAAQNNNDWVPIVDDVGTAIKGVWVILDLGLFTSEVPILGSASVPAFINSKSTVGADTVDYDWVAFVPANEGSGRLTFPNSFINTSNQLDINDRSVLFDNNGGGVWTRATYEGDYLRIPPAGAEARTVQFITFLAGGSGTPLSSTVAYATNLDATTATLTYTPRYLVVPSS